MTAQRNNVPKTAQQEYITSKIEQIDNGEFHLPYHSEMNFYNLVKQGNIEELENTKLIVKGQGVLSDDKFSNIQYHFVISTAFS